MFAGLAGICSEVRHPFLFRAARAGHYTVAHFALAARLDLVAWYGPSAKGSKLPTVYRLADLTARQKSRVLLEAAKLLLAQDPGKVFGTGKIPVTLTGDYYQDAALASIANIQSCRIGELTLNFEPALGFTRLGV